MAKVVCGQNDWVYDCTPDASSIYEHIKMLSSKYKPPLMLLHISSLTIQNISQKSEHRNSLSILNCFTVPSAGLIHQLFLHNYLDTDKCLKILHEVHVRSNSIRLTLCVLVLHYDLVGKNAPEQCVPGKFHAIFGSNYETRYSE